MAKSGHVTGMCLCDRLPVRKPEDQQSSGFLYQYVSHAHSWWFKAWRQGASCVTQQWGNKESESEVSGPNLIHTLLLLLLYCILCL